MIISKTPFRISFVGGGSDLKEFYSYNEGAVFSTSINKYMFITSHKHFSENIVRVKYSQTETVNKILNIKHPIFREVLKYFEIKGALELSSTADLPSGTGLGSSSSFTVGLLHNLFCRKKIKYNRKLLAEEACKIEIEKLKEPIGKQDQYAAAYGGLNIFKFNKNGFVDVVPININKKILHELDNNLLLFYTGIRRKTSSILNKQKQRILNKDIISSMKKMVELVWDMKKALENKNLNDFGKILHQNWMYKRELTDSITNTTIDEIYMTALNNGAIGGKLLGAGGGGFILFYCEKKYQKKLRIALSNLKELDFCFESEGSKIVFKGE